MDCMHIKQLMLSMLIGTRPAEQITPQTVYIDLTYSIDLLKAVKHDALADTIDYCALEIVLTQLAKTPCALIETFAVRVMDYLQAHFGKRYYKLCVSKPLALEHAQCVSIEMERGSR